jgi:hypothetical protein
MLWLKHFTDARRNPKLLRIEKKLGEVGYARAFKLLEIVGERGGRGAKFNPVLDLNGPATDIEWLAGEMNLTADETRATLDVFSAVELIDPNSWQRLVVSVPQMLEYRDEYTERRQKPRRAGPLSHSLPKTETETEQSKTETVPMPSGEYRDRKDIPKRNPIALFFKGNYMELTEKQRGRLVSAFPWVDLETELRKMDTWLGANPSRRPRNKYRFAYNWVRRISPPKSDGDWPKIPRPWAEDPNLSVPGPRDFVPKER